MEFSAVFPGQGSQSVGMGRDFRDNHSLAAELFEAADKALGFSLSDLCFSGPEDKLQLTKYSQPAILTASVVAFQLLGKKPSVAAGHSLGEYSALVCAGALKFEDAVNLVYSRGCYMQEAVPADVGAMVAVMGPTPEEIKTAISSVEKGVVEIANLNSPGQTVVAGEKAAVASFSEIIGKAGAKVIPLKVSAPFHCSLMQSAADKLANDLEKTSFSPLQFPVYANVSAQKISSENEARELLKQQVCGSVRWSETVGNIVADESIKSFVEFGPGVVLSRLIKRIDKSTYQLNVQDSASLEKVKQALS